MLIDTSFDFRRDAGGKDPDAYSVTLCRYHKLLWSRVLPSGTLFDLEVSRRHGAYALHHRSELGEFSLTSDSIIHTYTRWSKLKHITELFSEEENEAFRTLGYTIGGMLVFPGNRIDRKQTINGARGCHWKIRDRFDLTLECIRRHYIGQNNPLEDTLNRYGDFFALFEDFRGYVEFFLLQDLVVDDYSAVTFLMPFDDFRTPSVPGDVDTYREYRRLTIEFVEARNRRIDRHAASLRGQAPQSIETTHPHHRPPSMPTLTKSKFTNNKFPPPQQPVALALPQVTVEMKQQVVDLMGDHGVVWLENDKYCIGVPTAQYLKKDLTNWKKFISNGNVRWASNVNFEAALKCAGSSRSSAARASAAERKAAAEAVTVLVEMVQTQSRPIHVCNEMVRRLIDLLGPG
jgi:hypothetical protein